MLIWLLVGILLGFITKTLVDYLSFISLRNFILIELVVLTAVLLFSQISYFIHTFYWAALTAVSKLAGGFFAEIETWSSNSLLATNLNSKSAVILALNLETSSFMELIAFVVIMIFYPAFHWRERLKNLVLGSLMIFTASIFCHSLSLVLKSFIVPGLHMVVEYFINRVLYFFLVVLSYCLFLTLPTLQTLNRKVRQKEL